MLVRQAGVGRCVGRRLTQSVRAVAVGYARGTRKYASSTRSTAFSTVAGEATPYFADFEVPERLIAQVPVDPPDMSRLMVIRREEGIIEHNWNFRDLPQLLDGSYTAVVNNAKVDNCKLLVDVPGGGREIIYVLGDGATPQFAGLVNNTALEGVYVISGDCLDRLPEGEALVVAEADGRHIEVEIVHRATSGTAVALFSKESDSDESLQAAVQAVAQVPLPPYIASLEGEKRYQTVFAEASGSVAAPTASLHFTEKVLEELRELESQGFRREQLTLHVGYGTFAAVDFSKDISQHHMPFEDYYLPYPTAGRLDADWANPDRKVLAVGTTVTRALESCAIRGQWMFENNTLAAGKGSTDLFISPGYEFRIVDAMLTNFHMPGLTPLSMVAAFMGPELTRQAYDEAIENEYRFYSFGDAMLIL
eukprot:INCI15456.1.p1 GENE.INCI15456.1~~INCI15456.1.p1  ORF type:complete len:421 (+),score=68.86 INCI15456.1:289-1551(+)